MSRLFRDVVKAGKKPEKFCQKDKHCALDADHEGDCSPVRPDCVECQSGTPVDHLGSSYCRSHSIASGGYRAHCTCSLCW